MLLPRWPLAFSLLLVVLLTSSLCLAGSYDDLRHRSIYQVLTDRFSRPDDILAPCDLARRPYCGGTWKGIERRLGYIQGMGFDTGASLVWGWALIGSVDLACGRECGRAGRADGLSWCVLTEGDRLMARILGFRYLQFVVGVTSLMEQR